MNWQITSGSCQGHHLFRSFQRKTVWVNQSIIRGIFVALGKSRKAEVPEWHPNLTVKPKCGSATATQDMHGKCETYILTYPLQSAKPSKPTNGPTSQIVRQLGFHIVSQVIAANDFRPNRSNLNNGMCSVQSERPHLRTIARAWCSRPKRSQWSCRCIWPHALTDLTGTHNLWKSTDCLAALYLSVLSRKLRAGLKTGANIFSTP